MEEALESTTPFLTIDPMVSSRLSPVHKALTGGDWAKVVQEDVDELNKYYFVLNPSIYTKYFTAFILLISIIFLVNYVSKYFLKTIFMLTTTTTIYDYDYELR